MKKENNTPNYRNYLELNSLLNAQKLIGEKRGKKAHDEMLFIITHQVYELWFKQILYELDSIFEVFHDKIIDESQVGIAVSRLQRINQIIQLLIDQIKILESMTPMDFLEFRDLLTPASGFQSGQFRQIENKIGLLKDNRYVYGSKDYKERIHKDEIDKVLESEHSEFLFTLIERWLERTPFLASEGYNFWEQYKAAVSKMILNDKKIIEENDVLGDTEKESYFNQYNASEKMFNSLFDESVFSKMADKGQFRLSYKATHAALLILSYSDKAILHNP